MLSHELRRSYVDFYTSRGHTEIPGSTLIGDSTVLFTSAGMQPLIPYFSGAPHPSGRRLVNVQRCLRTVDIDEVGDDTPPDVLRDARQLVAGRLLQARVAGLDARVAPGDRAPVRAPRRDRPHRGPVRARCMARARRARRPRARARRRGQLVGPAGAVRAVRAGLGDLLHPRRRPLGRARQQRLHRPRPGRGRDAARACRSTTSTSGSASSGSSRCCRASRRSTRRTCSRRRCSASAS